MDHETTEEYSGPRFEPALWRQRKLFACQTLVNNGVTSVIDFGCGEGALTSTLISCYDEDNPITRVAAVDISRECLDEAVEVCKPQALDLGDHARPFELILQFFQGSVDAADERLLGYEGLACMEVIEHLDPPVLAGFWSVVLGIYQPKVVVVSTPNAEFNVHFANLQYGTQQSTFRHWDHRFEWTRPEFQQWCTEAAEQYGYSVEFSGVGTLDGREPQEGFCSQIAVLKRSDAMSDDGSAAARMDQLSSSLGTSTPYELVATIEYPFYNTEHSEDELLEFLHDRIALIRPLPQSGASMDDGPVEDDLRGREQQRQQQQQEEENMDVERQDSKCRVQQVPEQGCFELRRLWGEYQVQQRVKTRKRLIELLGLSSLVRLSEDQTMILYDEADGFWQEFEKRYKERFRHHHDNKAVVRDEHLIQYVEDDGWESYDPEESLMYSTYDDNMNGALQDDMVPVVAGLEGDAWSSSAGLEGDAWSSSAGLEGDAWSSSAGLEGDTWSSATAAAKSSDGWGDVKPEAWEVSKSKGWGAWEASEPEKWQRRSSWEDDRQW